MKTFQRLVCDLQDFWKKYGCISIQPYDIEIGAATFHPITFFHAIGPEPIAAVYVQSSRRPVDGRYGKSFNRLQHYYQLQVIIKPSPDNIQELFLDSLQQIGINYLANDVRFVEDNWKNPTLGAWGLGWEVWLNGMEITQFTYFQHVGGLECMPITGEIAYGLERLALFLQKVDTVYDLVWDHGLFGRITYGDLFYQSELEQSMYNFNYVNVEFLIRIFSQYEKEIQYLMSLKNPLSIPAYEKVLKAVHIFNLLDARKAISVTERQNYILRINKLSKIIAENYYLFRKNKGFPMCKYFKNKK